MNTCRSLLCGFLILPWATPGFCNAAAFLASSATTGAQCRRHLSQLPVADTAKTATGICSRSGSVEQIDVDTGEVVARFPSAAAAQVATRTWNVYQVLSGRQRTANGYFWRHEGSTATVRPQVLRSSWDTRSKRIEQIDVDTGNVIGVFPSIYAAASETNTKNIASVLSGRTRTSNGYFWRYHGSSATRRKRKPLGPQNVRQVEQICPTTGEVLETHASVTVAAKKFGVVPGTIRAVCKENSDSSLSARGYFWRYKGSNKRPRPNRRKRPVVQICKESGAVLRSFGSVSEAARHVGVTRQAIDLALHGKSKSAGGFFWK